MDNQSTIIIGAGLAGLATAYHLKNKYYLVEAQNRVGGLTATDHVKGFDFDQAGHLLHVKSKSVKKMLTTLEIDSWPTCKRDARIVSLGKICRYPFQSNLFNLPAEIKAQALLDYLQAVTSPPSTGLKNFEQWSQAAFGKTITALFLKPYNEKLWTVPANTLTLDWMSRFFPKPDVARVIRGALLDLPESGGYNATFRYPRQGGMGQLAERLATKVRPIHLNAAVTQIDIKNRWLMINGQHQHSWQQVVSTMPLPALLTTLGELPLSIKRARSLLHWNSVLVINLGVKGPAPTPAHWLYFPEKKYSFYRVGFPGNFGRVTPRGCSSLYAEVALPAGTGWTQRHHIAGQVKKDLIKASLVKNREQIITEHIQYIPYAYVIYNQSYQSARRCILDYLSRHRIYSIGRWGSWEYSAMEDALLAGRQTAKVIKNRSNT